MAAIDFPNSPSVNDVFTDSGAGVTWVWNGTTWAVQATNPTTASGAVRFPSSLTALGYTSSGDYWLTGKGTTPQRIYCFYDGGSFWARVANIPRGANINFNGYTTTVGTDFSLSNTALFNLRSNLFGDDTGENLDVMMRVVGGSFAGAIASTPGIKVRNTYKGLPLNFVLNGTLTSNTASTAVDIANSVNNNSTSTTLAGAVLANGGDFWIWANSVPTGGNTGAWNTTGWLLHSNAIGTKNADQFFGRVGSSNLFLNADASWSRAELYIRI